jgi:hypothetical protein
MPDNSLPSMKIQSKINNHLSLIIWLGALYYCRETFTDVMSALQIHLFMQNEPNFQKSQVDITSLITDDYEQMDTWSIRKNEPKTNPNEPKTNPILANKTPIRTQFKPNLSCRSLWRSRNKPNFSPQKGVERRYF